MDDLQTSGSTVEISSGNVLLTIPTGAIDTDSLSESLEITDKSKIPVSVSITDKGNMTYEFTVTATYGGQSYPVERFNVYVSSDIKLPIGYGADQVTTAVRTESGGSNSQVPTYVYQGTNGSWYARINHLTNSEYKLITNSVTFEDVSGKWYKDTANELGSRLILTGYSDGEFKGESNVTRAEFTAMLVRTLGLPTNVKCSFSDVSKSDWYFSSVGVASEYGLISGIGDNKFDPNSFISREEAMKIIMNACSITKLAGGTAAISGYTDLGTESSWAANAVKFNLENGLITGTGEGLIAPHGKITRAEAATIILRMMEKTKLYDIRTKN